MLEHFAPRIFEAALEPEAWWPLVEDISAEFNHTPVYLSQSSPSEFGRGDIWMAGMDRNLWRSVPKAAQTPEGSQGLRRFLAAARGKVLDRTQLVADEDLDKDPLAGAFLRNNGLFHASLSLVQADDETASVFWLARPREAPLNRGELAKFSALLPPIGSAMEVHRRLRQAQALTRGLAGALDQLEDGAILLDQHLRVYFHNAVAEEVFAANGPLRCVGGYLRARSTQEQRAILQAATGAAGAGGANSARIVLGGRDTGSLAVEITFAPAIGAASLGSAVPANIIAFLRPLQRPPRSVPLEVLVSELGLTRAEARVAQLAAQACSPGETADTLGMTRNTVKSHLKSIYTKLDVHSQAELVLRLLSRAY